MGGAAANITITITIRVIVVLVVCGIWLWLLVIWYMILYGGGSSIVVCSMKVLAVAIYRI